MTTDSLIQITDTARAKIREYMDAEARPGLALRLAIAGRGPAGFEYKLGFIAAAERAPEDASFDVGGIPVVVDALSLENLRGASIDFVTASYGSGFKIDNPNPLWTDPVAVEVQKLLDSEINPAVGSHGGHVTLLDVKDGRVILQFGGGCQGCGMVDVTLKQGIEVRIKEQVPAVREVIDSTDHAGGTNPYYRPSARGASPVAR